MTGQGQPVRSPLAVAWASLLLFLFFVPFAFSEELVNAAYDACAELDRRPGCGVADSAQVYLLGRWLNGWDLLLLGVDTFSAPVLFVVAVRLRRLLGARLPRRDLIGWFLVAYLATLAIDFAAVGWGNPAGEYHDPLLLVWSVGLCLLWIVALALMLAVFLGIDPRRELLSRPRAGWQRLRPFAPLIIGTFVAWIAGALWDFALADPDAVGTRVDQEFFAQASQVVPLLFVALAVEAQFFRRPAQDALERAAGIVTVATMCFGEIVVLSVLVAGDQAGASLMGWHEFAAYIFGLEAIFVGLATLVWSATGGFTTRAPDTPPGPPSAAVPPDPALAPASARVSGPAPVSGPGRASHPSPSPASGPAWLRGNGAVPLLGAGVVFGVRAGRLIRRRGVR
ncbi:hypothetical protein KIH74_32135 [Kineosporia sp. J2-2]|uniref:Integral membrane protein n=1 Tax=Kineosporia corallincola TaxID=2835133 RepID=A0ABS5TS76_9ACTN|nr:hypothetical protein [Kineosporia corallincola]MBT0773638.1 hypothetical protein [Kineosporia corallincola]